VKPTIAVKESVLLKENYVVKFALMWVIVFVFRINADIIACPCGLFSYSLTLSVRPFSMHFLPFFFRNFTTYRIASLLHTFPEEGSRNHRIIQRVLLRFLMTAKMFHSQKLPKKNKGS